MRDIRGKYETENGMWGSYGAAVGQGGDVGQIQGSYGAGGDVGQLWGSYGAGGDVGQLWGGEGMWGRPLLTHSVRFAAIRPRYGIHIIFISK